VTLPNLVADRRLNLEFPASLQPETAIVENGACNSATVRQPSDRSKPHPGCLADDFEDRRHLCHPPDSLDVYLDVIHGIASSVSLVFTILERGSRFIKR
jgi:hypothetical protein